MRVVSFFLNEVSFLSIRGNCSVGTLTIELAAVGTFARKQQTFDFLEGFITFAILDEKSGRGP